MKIELYHGSLDKDLKIGEKNYGGFEFDAIFFTKQKRLAREYGEYVYQCSIDIDEVFFTEDLQYLDSDDVYAALLQVMSSHDIDKKHFDLCYHVVVLEDADAQEKDSFLSVVQLDDDDDEARWLAQSMRIAFASRLGFRAVAMNDECGSIALMSSAITSLRRCDDDDDDDC